MGTWGNVLKSHLHLVIPMLYPCHYTHLCPHLTQNTQAGFVLAPFYCYLWIQVTTQKKLCPTESEKDWDEGKKNNRMTERSKEWKSSRENNGWSESRRENWKRDQRWEMECKPIETDTFFTLSEENGLLLSHVKLTASMVLVCGCWCVLGGFSVFLCGLLRVSSVVA